MKINCYLIAIVAFLNFTNGCVGAFGAGTTIDVAFVNDSSSDIGDVRARFGKNEVGMGLLGRTSTKIYGSYKRPITIETEVFWELNGTKKSAKIDLKGIIKSGKSGQLTFTFTDKGVGATFEELIAN